MSLLSVLTSDRVEGQPFPHVVVPRALDEALIRQLARELPPFSVVSRGRAWRSNQKFIWSAHRALHHSALSTTWQRLFRELVAPEAWSEWMRIFRAPLLAEYPDVEARFGPLDRWRVGIRDIDDAARCDALLDAKIVAHAPVAGPPALERGPHVKRLNALFLGYLYLRPEEDEADGADHVLYSVPPGAAPSFDDRQSTALEGLRIERVVPQRRNTLVAFLNTPRSIQGLATRGPSPRPMFALHFTAHLRQPLFTLNMKPGARPLVWEDARWYRRRPQSLLAGAWRRAAAALVARG